MLGADSEAASCLVYEKHRESTGFESSCEADIFLQDSTATTYTIFCADTNVEHCQIAGDLPFIFAEGARTLSFSGVDPGIMYDKRPTALSFPDWMHPRQRPAY